MGGGRSGGRAGRWALGRTFQMLSVEFLGEISVIECNEMRDRWSARSAVPGFEPLKYFAWPNAIFILAVMGSVADALEPERVKHTEELALQFSIVTPVSAQHDLSSRVIYDIPQQG